MTAARQSLRAPTRGSSRVEHTSALSRRCSFLQEAAKNVAEKLPQLAAVFMSSAQLVAREGNLPRGVFKGVSCCVACGHPTKSAEQMAAACKLCDYFPRKRKRGAGHLRSTKANVRRNRVQIQVDPVASATEEMAKAQQKDEVDRQLKQEETWQRPGNAHRPSLTKQRERSLLSAKKKKQGGKPKLGLAS